MEGWPRPAAWVVLLQSHRTWQTLAWCFHLENSLGSSAGWKKWSTNMGALVSHIQWKTRGLLTTSTTQDFEHVLAYDHLLTPAVDSKWNLVGWTDPQTWAQHNAQITLLTLPEGSLNLSPRQRFPKVDDRVVEDTSTARVVTAPRCSVVEYSPGFTAHTIAHHYHGQIFVETSSYHGNKTHFWNT